MVTWEIEIESQRLKASNMRIKNAQKKGIIIIYIWKIYVGNSGWRSIKRL